MASVYNVSDNNISLYLNGSPDTTATNVYCHQAKFLIHTVVAGIICIIGLLGNTASLYVLSKDNQSPVATFLLQILAVIDNIFLCLFLLHFSIKHFFYYTNMAAQRDLAWIYTRMYTYPLLFVTQTSTIWLTVIIALSRYVALCIPYRASSLVTMQNAQRCVIAIITFSFLYNLPRYFESYLSVSYVNGTRKLGLVYTVLGESRIYQLVYFDILYYIFSFVLPLLLLIVLNTRLIVAYRALQAKRAKMNLRQESDNNITLVMIIIILSFIVCQAPARIVQIVWNYTSPGCHVYQFYVIQISTVLEVLNSSNNFFIYTALRKQFRNAMLDIFCPCSNCSRLGGFSPVSTNGRTTTATTYTTTTAVAAEADENCKETFC